MINIHIENEYSKLNTVILGIANDTGKPPLESDTYDPRSLYHIKNNSYPVEEDLLREVDSFHDKLIKHNVNVIRPKNINDCNQIFCKRSWFCHFKYVFFIEYCS